LTSKKKVQKYRDSVNFGLLKIKKLHRIQELEKENIEILKIISAPDGGKLYLTGKMDMNLTEISQIKQGLHDRRLPYEL
jgi:hypothetical protein